MLWPFFEFEYPVVMFYFLEGVSLIHKPHSMIESTSIEDAADSSERITLMEFDNMETVHAKYPLII